MNTFWRLYDDFEGIDGLTSMQRSKFLNMSQKYPKVVIKFSLSRQNLVDDAKTVNGLLYFLSEYKSQLSKQWNCWSLRCSWSIYIFIPDLTPGFNGLGTGNKLQDDTRSMKVLGIVRLILEIWRQSFFLSFFWVCPPSHFIMFSYVWELVDVENSVASLTAQVSKRPHVVVLMLEIGVFSQSVHS